MRAALSGKGAMLEDFSIGSMAAAMAGQPMRLSAARPIWSAFARGAPGLHVEALTPQENSALRLMWQDSSGSTLVDAYEQPIGKWICPFTGRFFSQSSAGARPTLTARVNLLLATESFANAAWSKLSAGTGSAPVCTDNYATAPDGTTTAMRVQFNSGAGTTASDISYLAQTVSQAGSARLRVFAKTNDGSTKVISMRGPAWVSPQQITVTGDWQEFTATGTNSAGAAQFLLYGTYGNATADILFWHPDLRTAADAAKSIPAYQRVGATAADYDTYGFPPRVVGNGASHWMSASLDMSSTDKVCAVASVTKYSDSAAGIVFELTTTSGNAGSFGMLAPSSGGGNNFRWYGRGVSAGVPEANANSLAGPVSSVITGISDIAADTTLARSNGVQTGSSSTDAGTGNFANSTLYLFARAGTSVWGNVGISALTIRGGSVADGLRDGIERYHKNLARLVY